MKQSPLPGAGSIHPGTVLVDALEAILQSFKLLILLRLLREGMCAEVLGIRRMAHRHLILN